MLNIKNLSKSFGTKVVFKDFCLEFEDVGLYLLTGESGIGKTTLLRIISGLDLDFSGEISGLYEKSVSYAFQEHRLFPTLTALENVTVTRDDDVGLEARLLLLRLGFAEADMQLYPHELSGGMRQRVSLARAFLYESDILLLDEPTKELDAALAEQVRTVIRELAASRLVIVVSHNEKDMSIPGAKIINITLPSNANIQ